MSRPFNVLKSFWNRVEKLGNESGCWIWTGGCTESGYGIFHPGKGMNYGAHRFSAELAGMTIGSMNVCHKCDTPSCVNPSHLFISTQLGNIRDKVAKNRQAKGEKNGACKLSEIAVSEIREIYRTKKTSQRKLAKSYGVSQFAIWNIVSGDAWKHVNESI